MYAAVTMFQIEASEIDETTRLYQEAVLPTVRALSGYRGGTILADRTTGRCFSIVLYATEADAQAPAQAGQLQEILSPLGKYFVGTPGREVYEVVFQDDLAETP